MRALFAAVALFWLAALACSPLAAMSPPGEPAVASTGEVRVEGEVLAYTALAGRVPIRDVETGSPRGFMFYVAYRVENARGPRPVMFIWNGGPGANSALLHFEAAGPRRLEGDRLVDNEDTWLTAADLVFVDPIGTGFSRPASADHAAEFYGTVGDVASVAEFVRAWRVLQAREHVPVLLAGESWGAGRAGSVGHALLERGVDVRALVLISGGAGINDLPGSRWSREALRVVDLAATAHYHGRLGPDLGDSPDAVRDAVRAWSLARYAPALENAVGLDASGRESIARELAHHTGLPASQIDPETLRVPPRTFREGLLGEQGEVLNVFDMRRVAGAPAEGAPGQRRRAILDYLRGTLGYRTDLPYIGLEELTQGYAPGGNYPPPVNARWNYATAEVTAEEREAAYQAAIRDGGGPPRLGPPLPTAAEAVVLRPGLKVLVAAGRFDSLASCSANEVLAGQLEPPLAEAYDFQCYEGGHMMYRDAPARRALARHIRTLVRSVD